MVMPSRGRAKAVLPLWAQEMEGQIAGDVDTETVHEQVVRTFGDIPPGPPVSQQTDWIAARTGTHRQTTLDKVPQSRIIKAWNIPGIGTTDGDYLDLASEVPAGGQMGITFGPDGSLYLVDAVNSQILRVAALDPGSVE